MIHRPLALIRRIAAMDSDEIRSRLGSFVRQRRDARHASRGRNPLDPGRAPAPARPPLFFFDPRQSAGIAAAVRARLPDEAAGVIDTARRIETGCFDLLGYRGLRFGREDTVDWHLDPVHNVRAPRLPWFRVPYLDFRRTGDHKIVWELSRHQHLMILARAWLYSGDARFVRALERLWIDWHAANPYPTGINWASTLEVAFRAMSWMWVDAWIGGAPGVTEEFRALLRQAIGESAVYTQAYLSTYFAPNTHLLGEGLALFLIGVMYPEFRDAAHWRNTGWRILLEESEHQVRPDGFHFEQSVYYHVYALEMFLYGRILAARNGMVVPESYDAVLIRMAEGLAAIGAAGQAPRFGDDDGGRLFDGRRNRPEHMLDPLAAAAAVFGRGDWKAVAGGQPREETLWLLGTEGLQRFDALPATPRKPRSTAFVHSGYYVLAGGGNALSVMDAGPMGWGSGGHGHADALSLQLLADGRAWLTDPGTCSYPMEKPERNRFRGTSAHNTLELDGRGQADPLKSFGWTAMPNVRAEMWHAGRHVTVLAGSHDGYARLPQPAVHRRVVLSWPDGIWLVRDVVTGEGSHELAVRWHLAPECALVAETESCWRAEDLRLCIPAGTAWTAHVETAQWSPAYGAVVDAPVLRLSRTASLPAECATLLAYNQHGPVSLESPAAEGAAVLVCRSGPLTRVVIYALEPGRGWRFGDWESEAVIAGADVVDDRVTHVFTVDEDLYEWAETDGGPPPVSREVLRTVHSH
jgi:hypothetical protein